MTYIRPNQIRFTKKILDNIPPNPRDSRSREKEYSDLEVVGLKCLVSKNGRKFFDMRYTFNKRKRGIRIGEYPAVSIIEARQRANEFKNMLSRGIDPREERDKKPDGITFGAFATDEYIPFAKENKKSWKDDVGKLNNDLLPEFGKRLMSDISTLDIQRYITKIKKRTSASTSNRHYALVNRMFNLAKQWEFLEKNPCDGIRKQKESGGKERFLNGEEIRAFIQSLDEDPMGVSAGVLKFLLFTGLRLGEALPLKWDDVNMDARIAVLKETKAGKSRPVVLNELALGVLATMREIGGSAYVFPGNGPKGHLTSPRRVFESAKKQAGITDLRIHDLRHTFASIAVNGGANIYEVQKLLGHQSSAMTQRYAHLSDQAVRDVSDDVAESIGRATA